MGPLLGALLGALTYQLVFRVRPACPARVRRASKQVITQHILLPSHHLQSHNQDNVNIHFLAQLSPAYERAVPGEDSPSGEEAAGGSRGKELVWIEK